MKKGMTVSVFKNAEIGDCTLGGASSKFNSIILVDDKLPKIFESREDEADVMVLVRRVICGAEYIHAVPLSIMQSGKHSMFGGNFVYTSDSRVREISPYPIPVHDRVEG